MSNANRTFWLCALAALLLTTATGDMRAQQQQQSQAEATEEFHQTYPLSGEGRVSLSNINGDVRVSVWDRNEVKVDAVKRARNPERLREVEIRVEASGDHVRIESEYVKEAWRRREFARNENPASVEYTLTVPRNARIDEISLINGSLALSDLAGSVKASSINGRVSAKNLSGAVNLSVINGQLDAGFDRLNEGGTVNLNSVNGSIVLTLPSDASAHLRANTVHGAISNDFNLPVRKGQYVGRDLEGRLGAGSARVRLNNVNGRVEIRRASDGRPLSGAVNLLSETPRNDSSSFDENEEAHDEAREAAREAVRASREARDALREAERERRDAQREAEREAREMTREAEREARDAERELRGDSARSRTTVRNEGPQRQIARESNSFAVGSAPRISIRTFDGAVTVRGWDRQEVAYTAVKRASSEREMQGIKVKSQVSGDSVLLQTEFDKTYAREYIERAGHAVVFSSGASVEMEVHVPRKATLAVSTGDGRLRIENVSGQMEIRTSDGSIDVIRSSGQLTASTSDGRIRVEDFDGSVDVRTGDGRITLDGDFKQLLARTGDGSIALSLPQSSNVNIETDSRSVSNDGVAVEEGSSGGRVRRWRVGGGGSTLILRTGDGQVILRRR